MNPDDRAKSRFSRVLLGAVAVAGPVLAVALIALLLVERESERPADAAAPAPRAPIGGATATAIGEGTGLQPPEPAKQPVAAHPATEREAEPERSGPAFVEETSMVVEVRKGESLELFDAPGGELAARQRDRTEFGSPSVFWVRRQTPGWLGVSTPELPNNEIAWVRADPRRLRADVVGHAAIVDLSARRARLFWKGRQISSWPVTVGAPGTETPTGRFAVTDTFEGDLAPAYGCCALALSATQPDLPSGWLGGNRIALHGTRGPIGVAASSGCVRSADRDVRAMLQRVELGTPVLIRE